MVQIILVNEPNIICGCIPFSHVYYLVIHVWDSSVYMYTILHNIFQILWKPKQIIFHALDIAFSS